MTEVGMLSIVRRGTTYQVRYAASDPYNLDCPSCQCPDEGTLVTLLAQWGIDAWSVQQAVAELRQGRMAVLPLVRSVVRMPAFSSSQRAPQVTRVPADLRGTLIIPSQRRTLVAHAWGARQDRDGA